MITGILGAAAFTYIVGVAVIGTLAAVTFFRVKSIDFSGGLLAAFILIAYAFVTLTWPVTLPIIVYQRLKKRKANG